MDHPAPSPLPINDAGMGENLDSEVYGLSNLRQSRWIAAHVERMGQQWWKSNASVHVVNDREESDEKEEDIEEEDIEYDELICDFDEGMEGYEEDNGGLFGGPGQEGISLWDSLGEGF